jgi:hypothetical protein
MKRIIQILLVVLAILPISVFGQVVYTFDVDGNGYTSNGTTYTNMVQYPSDFPAGTFGLTDAATLGLTFADGNATKLFKGITHNTNTSSVDLIAIPSTEDQQVEWTQYIKTETTSPAKAGIILRAQNVAAAYSPELRQGYYFIAQNNGSVGLVRFRCRVQGEIGDGSNLIDVSLTIPNYTTGPLYLKARAEGTSISLSYSLDNSNWTLVQTATDATFAAGTVQIAWGVGAGSSLDLYFDNLKFTNLKATSVKSIVSDYKLDVTVNGKNITVKNANSFSVYSLTGAKVREINSSEINNTITLNSGVYIIKSGSKVKKLVVN